MVRHRLAGEDWWCLPGGGIEPGESPEVAALRELREECLVFGRIVKHTSSVEYGAQDFHHTYLIDIGDQVPELGVDPEVQGDNKVLVDMRWMSLQQLSEADRVYLWTAGLLAVPLFAAEVSTWDRVPSQPKRKAKQSPHKLRG